MERVFYIFAKLGMVVFSEWEIIIITASAMFTLSSMECFCKRKVEIIKLFN